MSLPRTPIERERVEPRRNPPAAKAPQAGAPAAEQILHLQREMGNAAVQRLLSGTLQRMEATVQQPPKPEPKDGPYQNKRGAYDIGWVSLSPDEGGTLNVWVNGETDPIGRASFDLRHVPFAPPPGPDEPYTKEHIISTRTGLVAHLSGIYNNTLTRDGPADIYSGFGAQMLARIEETARNCGAWMIYLEAAPSRVRVDPNSNVKEMQDPAGFYAKFGWGEDLDQLLHNSTYLARQATQYGIDGDDAVAFITNGIRAHRGAIWTKVLKK